MFLSVTLPNADVILYEETQHKIALLLSKLQSYMQINDLAASASNYLV